MQVTQKPLYCRYISKEIEKFSQEGIAISLPTEQGYINYHLVHSVCEERNCNIWRLGPACHCNDALQDAVPLTRPLSEWEMAIRPEGRPDFIGGAVHGDEHIESLRVTLDGILIDQRNLHERTAFQTLTAEIRSTGYDPSTPTKRMLAHCKRITFDRTGVRVEQEVEWLTDARLTTSYLAMMPPLKSFTCRYRTDCSPDPRPIPMQGVSATECANTLCLAGDRGFSFSMTVEKYLSDGAQNTYYITDNGGNCYNKMYFVLAHGGAAKRGDVWQTATLYSIQKS